MASQKKVEAEKDLRKWPPSQKLLHITLPLGCVEPPQGWLKATKLHEFQANEIPVLSLSKKQSFENYYYYHSFNEPTLPSCSLLLQVSICFPVRVWSLKPAPPRSGEDVAPFSAALTLIGEAQWGRVTP